MDSDINCDTSHTILRFFEDNSSKDNGVPFCTNVNKNVTFKVNIFGHIMRLLHYLR